MVAYGVGIAAVSLVLFLFLHMSTIHFIVHAHRTLSTFAQVRLNTGPKSQVPKSPPIHFFKVKNENLAEIY